MTTPTTPPAIPPQARFFQWVQGWASLMLCHSLVKTGVFAQMAAGPTLSRALRMTTALVAGADLQMCRVIVPTESPLLPLRLVEAS